MHDQSVTTEARTFRILSGNVLQGLAMHRPEVALEDMAAAMKAYQPDVICLQEATFGKQGDPNTGYLGQLIVRQELKADFALTHQVRRPKGSIYSGIANLIRPEVNAETVEIPLSQQRFATMLRPIGRRALLATSFSNVERPLHIVNTHLSIPTGNNLRTRRQEWRKLKEVVEALDGDVIVTGDCNVRPNSQFIRWCNEHWTSVSDQKLPTWHNLHSVRGRTLLPRDRTIDYVFTNKNCQRKVTVEPLARNHSDHVWHAIVIEDDSRNK